MLSKQEYLAFEQEQAQKWQEPQMAKDVQNFERWAVSRYWDNPRRLLITARHELGYQYKRYADMGQWRGGTEFENRVYEEIQCYYRQQQSLAVQRTRIDNIALFEVQTLVDRAKIPKSLFLVIGKRVLCADAGKIKGGVRYNLK